MPEIVVLVKQVPDTNARIAISGDAVDMSGVKMVMSPYDEFALEAALRHKEAAGGNVTALTMGGAGADKVLKDAKAIGCLLYTSPSPRDGLLSRMPSSA